MENAINPEFNNQDIVNVPSESVCDGRSDQVITTTTTCIFCEHDHAAVLQEIDLATTTPEVSSELSECDLGIIRHKRVELDNIQKDLDDLMSRLNTFIAEVDENSNDDENDASSIEENDTEKQDGPSEKELKLNYLQANNKKPANEFYTSEPFKPPEINWEAVGPILQKHVADLQKIHILNQMTNAVVQRIRNVAHVDESIIKKQPNEKNCE